MIRLGPLLCASTRTLSRLADGLSPGHARFTGFVALSIALHLITVIGAGPLDLSVRRPGDAPGRTELQATLVTGESARPATAPAPDADKPAADADAAAAAPAAAAEGTARAGTDAERGLALPAPDKWYTASEVDVRAEPITEIRLRYPRELAETQRVTGTVRVRVFIDEGGVVRKLQIASSEPPGLFDEAAKLGWQDVRFSPARRNGVAVKSQKLIELTYVPETI